MMIYTIRSVSRIVFKSKMLNLSIEGICKEATASLVKFFHIPPVETIDSKCKDQSYCGCIE